MIDVPALHLLLRSIKLKRPHQDLFDPLDVVFGGCGWWFPSADVAPVGVGPPGIVEAAVQESKLGRLALHKLLEGEAPTPGKDKSLFHDHLRAIFRLKGSRPLSFSCCFLQCSGSGRIRNH